MSGLQGDADPSPVDKLPEPHGAELGEIGWVFVGFGCGAVGVGHGVNPRRDLKLRDCGGKAGAVEHGFVALAADDGEGAFHTDA